MHRPLVSWANCGASPTAHRALDTGQFRFWSKFKVPSFVQNFLVRSFGIFYATFDEQNEDFLLPEVKTLPEAQRTQKLTP